MVKKYKPRTRAKLGAGPVQNRSEASGSGFKETKKTLYQSKHGTGQADRAREELKGLEDLPLIGGLVKGLGKFIDLVGAVEEAGGEIKKKGEIKGKEGAKGIYGFSIRTGTGQMPKIQTFGNIKTEKPRPRKGRGSPEAAKIKITEEREPIVDVFDEKDHILIVAELPGVSEESIKLELKGDILILEAGDEKRKYSKEILLPRLRPTFAKATAGKQGFGGQAAKVDFEKKETSFKNGVLEIKIPKAE